MKSSAKKIELASVDDLFSTEESRQDEQLEKIQEIPLSELHPFKDHPFKVKDDDAMIETADSIKKYYFAVQMWQQRWDIPIHAKPSATIPGVERNVP